jgi:HK97 family phage major capsid protein
MFNTVAKRQARAAILKEARGILDLATTEKRENTAEEITTWEAKQAEAKRALESIDREERQLALDAETAVPILSGVPGTARVISPVLKREPGQGFTNCIRAIGVGGKDRRLAAQFAEETLHDGEVARALSSSVGTAGGFAVPTQLATEFIEFLRPASVIRSLGPRVLPMTNGNLSLPKITGGAVASYLGENQPIASTQQTMGQVKLVAKKLAAIVPISNDLIRFANPQTDATIRQDLVLAVAQCEDLNFISGPGTQYSPKGMKNWVVAANSFSASGTVDIPHITSDLGTAIANLLAANVNVTLESGAWIFNPFTFVFLKTLRNPTTGQFAFPEMQGPMPSLLGYRAKYTSQISHALYSGTQSEWYFVNMSDAVIGESANLVLDVSSEASYIDATSGQLVSAYAQDQTLIRVIEENDFAMRYDQSLSLAEAVGY